MWFQKSLNTRTRLEKKASLVYYMLALNPLIKKTILSLFWNASEKSSGTKTGQVL